MPAAPLRAASRGSPVARSHSVSSYAILFVTALAVVSVWACGRTTSSSGPGHAGSAGAGGENGSGSTAGAGGVAGAGGALGGTGGLGGSSDAGNPGCALQSDGTCLALGAVGCCQVHGKYWLLQQNPACKLELPTVQSVVLCIVHSSPTCTSFPAETCHARVTSEGTEVLMATEYWKPEQIGPEWSECTSELREKLDAAAFCS
jgi:hypothetical protein